MTPKQQAKEARIKVLFEAAGARVREIERPHFKGTYVFIEDLRRVSNGRIRRKTILLENK